MELPVLVEQTSDGRFRARVGEPFQVAAEADSVQHAVADVARAVQERLQSGAAIAVLTVTNGAVRPDVQSFPADEAYQTDWVYRELAEAIAEERRREDAAGP